jgi:hypothetical protein
MRAGSAKGRAVVLLLALAGAAFAQGPGPKGGNTPEAARAWLAANASSRDFPARFFAALAEEDDVGRAFILIDDFSGSLTSAEDRARAYRIAGGWAEAYGFPLDAAQWYEKALAELPGAPDPALELRTAVCRLKAGDAEEAFARSERVAGNSVEPIATRAKILSVWALAALGRRDDAVGRARILASSSLPPEAAPSAAYALAYLSGERGEDVVVADHPDALLLAALCGDGTGARSGVKALDEPVLFLSGILGDGALPEKSPGSEAASPAPGPRSPAPPEPAGSPVATVITGLSVAAAPSPQAGKGSVDGPSPLRSKIAGYHQAGAFAAEENAEALEARIAGAGFGAETRMRRSASGKLRYFVIVPYGEDGEPSYEALRKAGFETVPFPY